MPCLLSLAWGSTLATLGLNGLTGEGQAIELVNQQHGRLPRPSKQKQPPPPSTEPPSALPSCPQALVPSCPQSARFGHLSNKAFTWRQGQDFLKKPFSFMHECICRVFSFMKASVVCRRDGFGTVAYHKGHIAAGQMRKGRLHGLGTRVDRDGSRYAPFVLPFP